MGGLTFRKSLEAQQSGRIALIDGNLQVAGRIEEGQFFTFANVGIGLADFVDYFISLEHDAKTPAFSLSFEFITGNIHHYIFEMVYEYDLTFDPIVVEQGFEGILFDHGRFGLTDRVQALAVGDGQYGFSDAAHYIQGVPGAGAAKGYAYQDFGFGFEDHIEQAIVGADDILSFVKGQEDLFGFIFKEVYQYNMEAEVREVFDGIAAYIGGLGIVEGSEAVGDIHHLKGAADLEQLAFDSGDEVVFFSNIGYECY